MVFCSVFASFCRCCFFDKDFPFTVVVVVFDKDFPYPSLILMNMVFHDFLYSLSDMVPISVCFGQESN